jgi:hypothetical protein
MNCNVSLEKFSIKDILTSKFLNGNQKFYFKVDLYKSFGN